MPRYGLIQMRLHQGFSVHSTEPNVVEWAITQIRQAYPKYKFGDQHKYGFLRMTRQAMLNTTFESWHNFCKMDGNPLQQMQEHCI